MFLRAQNVFFLLLLLYFHYFAKLLHRRSITSAIEKHISEFYCAFITSDVFLFLSSS